MKQETVTCDQCGSDLTTTSNCVGYRIVVANQTIPSIGGFVTAMGVVPPLESTLHFCGTGCLKKYFKQDE